MVSSSLCRQKGRRIASHLTATCQMLWDMPVFPTALYSPSHFTGCLSKWINLLPDEAHLAESVADAAARFSQRFRVLTKSSKKLTLAVLLWLTVPTKLQQEKQEGSSSACSHST